jgi:hypothetical protein
MKFTKHQFTRVSAFALMITGPSLHAQETASVTLVAPSASLATQFTRITAVRELADGRLLVVDEGDNKVVVVDWRAQSVRQVGRNGASAGEYRSVQRLFAIGHDSSLLPDPANGRWLLMAHDSIVGQLAAATPVVRSLGVNPLGADAAGFVVNTRPRIINGVPQLDSLVVIRGSRGTGRVDTLGVLLNRRPDLPGGRIDPTKPVPISYNPLAAGEQLAVFPDGWIALARLHPYRVEWVAPDGRRVKGPALPLQPTRVDAREKSAVLERESRATGREPRNPEAVGSWPETVPAFLTAAILPSTDGSLWIRRTPTRDKPLLRYDVVDRTGTLVMQVQQPESEQVVGFGRGSVYTVKSDADGIQTLRRHVLRVP